MPEFPVKVCVAGELYLALALWPESFVLSSQDNDLRSASVGWPLATGLTPGFSFLFISTFQMGTAHIFFQVGPPDFAEDAIPIVDSTGSAMFRSLFDSPLKGAGARNG